MVVTMAQPIKNLLTTLIKPKHSWHIQLLSSWDSTLGKLSSKVRLEKIDDDTLVLGVYDSCWMQELYLMTPMLIATINKKLDQPYIKHLRFKRVVARKHTPQPVVLTLPPNHQEVTLKPTEYAALEKIKDPQLSMALQQFLIRCIRRKNDCTSS